MLKKPMLLVAVPVAAALLFVATACGAAGGAFAPSEWAASGAPAEEKQPRAEPAEVSAGEAERPDPALAEATEPRYAPPEGASWSKPGGGDREQEEGAALARDAEAISAQMGVNAEEALRRLELQQDVSLKGLQGALAEEEKDTFAGFWIQHQPEYKHVALFTRGARETIRPYVEGKPWADSVEARNGADATLEELKAEQAEAARVLRVLVIPFEGGIRQQENRVKLRVTDRAWLETALRGSGERLPEHVEVEQVGGLSEPK